MIPYEMHSDCFDGVEREGRSEELIESLSSRANATPTTHPVENHLWCINDEFSIEDGRAVSFSLTSLQV